MNFSPGLKAFLFGKIGFLFLLSSAAADVTLTQLSREYTGSPLAPAATTVPAGLPVSLLYQNVSDPGLAALETVFDNSPAVLPLSTTSISYSAHRINGFGNYVSIAGNARLLKSCEITFVNWARAAEFPALAALNPAGYIHPVTVAIFAVTPAQQLIFLTDVERNILVPWRPDFLPGGQPYPFNGTAFRANFDFTSNLKLPDRVLISVEYNTSIAGFNPIGQPGPYDKLNLAAGGAAASVGADVDPDVVLRVTPSAWHYPNTGYTGNSGPIVRVRASTGVTKAPPVIPGSYPVTAMAGLGGTEGTASATLTISPSTFAGWLTREFTAAQQLAGEAAAGADPDGDGWDNYAEFALGTPPRTAGNPPSLRFEPGDPSITLTRPRYLAGVSYIPEESTNLTVWNPLAYEILTTTPTEETIRANGSGISPGRPRSFMRFRFGP
jgi:MBG domain